MPFGRPGSTEEPLLLLAGDDSSLAEQLHGTELGVELQIQTAGKVSGHIVVAELGRTQQSQVLERRSDKLRTKETREILALIGRAAESGANHLEDVTFVGTAQEVGEEAAQSTQQTRTVCGAVELHVPDAYDAAVANLVGETTLEAVHLHAAVGERLEQEDGTTELHHHGHVIPRALGEQRRGERADQPTRVHQHQVTGAHTLWDADLRETQIRQHRVLTCV